MMTTIRQASVLIGVVAIAMTLFQFERLSGQGGGPGGPAAGRGQGQGRGVGAGGATGGRGQQPPSNLPTSPTAVTLPTISPEITGPGPIFDSTPSLAAGHGLAHYNYEAKEYFVSGTANGQPYKSRIVVRMPADKSKFSG